MPNTVAKAFEITDARITFVSLVDKAANKRTFLLVKQEDGKATFRTAGRILKAEPGSHYVTGIVYEPLVEDTDGNFMSEEEITKAAYWYMKNGEKVDLQHSFEPMEGARVVESWVAKADSEIEGQPVRKGTWLMTVEVTNEEVWKSIEKGEITGFSMGGVGEYSTKDVDIQGAAPVTKQDFTDMFRREFQENGIWLATEVLVNSLRNPLGAGFITDENTIRKNLEAFNDALTSLLKSGDPLYKSISSPFPNSVQKAGRAMSTKNLETLRTIRDSIDEFCKAFEPEEEQKEPPRGEQQNEGQPQQPQEQQQETEQEPPKPESESKEEQPQQQAPAASQQSSSQPEGNPQEGEEEEKRKNPPPATTTKSVKKEATKLGNEPVYNLSAEQLESIVTAAVEKAVGETTPTPEQHPETPMQITADQLSEMVQKAVNKAVEPVLKTRGNPQNLNGANSTEQKEEVHYLHGIL